MPPLGERIRLKLLFTQCKQLRTSSALRAHTSRQLTKIRTMTMFTTAQFSIFRSLKKDVEQITQDLMALINI